MAGLPRISGMAKKLEPIADALTRISRELEQLSRRLTAGESPVEPPKEALAKAKAGLCLQCGRAKKPKELFDRGLCPKDASATRRRLAQGVSEQELIARGMILPPLPGGRKSQHPHLDDLLGK